MTAVDGGVRPRRLPVPVLGLLLALATWPIPSATPCAGLDCSWRYGLTALLSTSWSHPQVTGFTYGPLGALVTPNLASRWVGAAALLVALAVQAALCSLLLRRLERQVPPVLAGVLTYAVVRLVTGPEVGETIVLVGLLAATEVVQAGTRRPQLLWAGGCLLTATAMLTKLSTGLSLLGLLAVAAAAQHSGSTLGRWARLRDGSLIVAATAGTVAVLTAVVFSVVTLRPAALPRWVSASRATAGGYTAMGVELAGTGRQYVYAAILLLVLAVVGLAAARAGAKGAAWSLLMVGAVAYVKFREGFVRHDGHAVIFFTAVAVLALSLPLGRRTVRVALLTGAAAALVVFGVGLAQARDYFQLYDGPRAGVDEAMTVLSGQRFATMTAEARRSIAGSDAVPAAVLALLRGHTVQVDPWETAAVFAYHLQWRPVYAWHLYAAYTPVLDADNARSITESDAPERILRMPAVSIDSRAAAFESPAYQLAVACRYRPILSAGGWQVLARGRDTCQRQMDRGSATARPGDDIAVPQPLAAGDLIVARLRLGRSLGQRLATAVFKPTQESHIDLGGSSHRLVVTTAAQPLVLVAPPGLLPSPEIDAGVRRISVRGGITSVTVAFSEIVRG